MPSPLVSCVMPTFDRRRFVPEAIENFRLQTYSERELVIVDDGTDPVDDLVPDDPRIRYVHLDRRLSTGAKRNTACEAATGEIIVHWDDDDWSAPDRVAAQVEALTDGVDVCGLRDLWFYDLTTDRGWLYRYPPRLRPWVAGGTMCYRRGLWERHPFPDVRHGEDTQFVWSKRPLRIAAIDRRDLYVAMIHGRNTAAKRTAGRRWTTVPAAEIRSVLGPAAARYCRATGWTSATARPRARPKSQEETTMTTTRSAAPKRTDAAPSVTVSIPHAGPGEHLRDAVDSILGQTHDDLRCVVVLDGDRRGLDVLADIDDPRLVRFELPANHGRYFADQVVLDATDSPFFVVQDSDDWSAPTRIERLLAELDAKGADACVSRAVLHDRRRGSERTTTVSWPRLHDPVGPRLVHRAGHQGIYRVDALRRGGGFYGGHRIGFDTSVLNLLLLVGAIVVSVDEPLYHRRIRSDSLSTSAVEGWGTAERRRVVGELSDLQRRAYHAASTAVTPDDAAAAVAALVAGGRSNADRRALRAATDALCRAFAGEEVPDRATARPAPAKTVPRPPALDDVLDRFGSRNAGWAISPLGATELYHRLLDSRPARLLDVGSGLSTVVAAAALAVHGGRVVSLEHDPGHAERTRGMLDEVGLDGVAEVRVAPLVERRHRSGSGPWYDGEPSGVFDFFAVDGPPLGTGGRIASFPELIRHRRGNWEFWLFDADRPDEADCLARWARCHRFRSVVEPIDATGVAVIRPTTGTTRSAPVVDDLGISILAGGRPNLLEHTLDGFERRWAAQAESAYVCALVNGPDDASRAIFERRAWIDRLVSYEQAVLTIGMATSFLVGAVAGHGSVRAVLHLEDDWETVTLDDTALARASELLDDPTVGQVRLRHRSEPVLDRHMVTRRPIIWTAGERYRRSDAHFTFNPAVIRADVADRVFPALDEMDAQRRFLTTGLDVVQIEPGMFRHTGEHESRRAALLRRR